MLGYPWIYWLVVLIVSGVVSLVLIGIGYLFGLQVAARRVEQVRREVERASAERWELAGGYAKRYQDLADAARQIGGV